MTIDKNISDNLVDKENNSPNEAEGQNENQVETDINQITSSIGLQVVLNKESAEDPFELFLERLDFYSITTEEKHHLSLFLTDSLYNVSLFIDKISTLQPTAYLYILTEFSAVILLTIHKKLKESKVSKQYSDILSNELLPTDKALFIVVFKITNLLSQNDLELNIELINKLLPLFEKMADIQEIIKDFPGQVIQSVEQELNIKIISSYTKLLDIIINVFKDNSVVFPEESDNLILNSQSFFINLLRSTDDRGLVFTKTLFDFIIEMPSNRKVDYFTKLRNILEEIGQNPTYLQEVYSCLFYPTVSASKIAAFSNIVKMYFKEIAGKNEIYYLYNLLEEQSLYDSPSSIKNLESFLLEAIKKQPELGVRLFDSIKKHQVLGTLTSDWESVASIVTQIFKFSPINQEEVEEFSQTFFSTITLKSISQLNKFSNLINILLEKAPKTQSSLLETTGILKIIEKIEKHKSKRPLVSIISPQELELLEFVFETFPITTNLLYPILISIFEGSEYDFDIQSSHVRRLLQSNPLTSKIQAIKFLENKSYLAKPFNEETWAEELDNFTVFHRFIIPELENINFAKELLPYLHKLINEIFVSNFMPSYYPFFPQKKKVLKKAYTELKTHFQYLSPEEQQQLLEIEMKFQSI